MTRTLPCFPKCNCHNYRRNIPFSFVAKIDFTVVQCLQVNYNKFNLFISLQDIYRKQFFSSWYDDYLIRYEFRLIKVLKLLDIHLTLHNNTTCSEYFTEEKNNNNMHSKQSTEYAFTHPKCDPIYLIPKCYGTSHNPKAVFEAEKKW